jgi:hypothetical protein
VRTAVRLYLVPIRIAGPLVENRTEVRSWLRHCATNRKVTGSRPDETIGFLSVYLVLPTALDPGVQLVSNRNEDQKQKNYVLGE